VLRRRVGRLDAVAEAPLVDLDRRRRDGGELQRQRGPPTRRCRPASRSPASDRRSRDESPPTAAGRWRRCWRRRRPKPRHHTPGRRHHRTRPGPRSARRWSRPS
jgi:hypothetical protein